MLVYIFGGVRTDYLELQVDAIRKNVPEASDIRYLQGPLHANSTVSSAAEFTDALPDGVIDIRISPHEVIPDIKPIRLANLIEHCLTNFDDSRSLFLHGDCVPFDDVDSEKILNGHGSAGPRGFNRQWFLVDGYDGLQDFQVYSVSSFTKSQWNAMLPGVPLQLMQIYYPSFLHFDNYSTDDQATIEIKKESYELLWG